MATWTSLILLLSIHLAMNHAAVRAVSMHTLNRQRANIVLSNFLDGGKVLTPDEVSVQERIFEWDGALRWKSSGVIGKAYIGISLQKLLHSLATRHSITSSVRDADVDIERLIELYRSEGYILWLNQADRTAYIVLKDGTGPTSSLKGWAHALWASQQISIDATSAGCGGEAKLELLRRSLEELTSRWDELLGGLRAAGWDLGSASLETSTSTRIRLQASR